VEGRLLPFPPFDLFDWLARRLPGALLTSGIDAMVKLLHAVRLGRTDTAAKMVEQTLALALWIVLGAVAALLLAAPRRRAVGSALVPGLLVGGAVGVGALASGRPWASASVGAPSWWRPARSGVRRSAASSTCCTPPWWSGSGGAAS
jgi:hypothetical protein